VFDRPEHLLFSVRESEEVKLASGETPEAAYQAWFARCSATPRFCARHRHAALIFSRKSSGFLPVYEPDGDPEPVAKPGEFNFRAVFACPSCCVAYALCPPEFHDTSFGTFDTSTQERAATLARAREFAAQVNEHGCGFALFVGPTGPGKTRLACNIVRALEDRDALYVRQGQLTCALRSTYDRKDVFLHRNPSDDEEAGDDDPPTPLEIVQEVRFLVLDEIGCTALANDERLLLDELLKHRYEQRKPTILISNLPLTGPPDKPGLKEFLGDALTDRIKEATGAGKFVVQFSGESYRRSTGESYLEGLGCTWTSPAAAASESKATNSPAPRKLTIYELAQRKKALQDLIKGLGEPWDLEGLERHRQLEEELERVNNLLAGVAE
jgi:DNA replication protein DnaC